MNHQGQPSKWISFRVTKEWEGQTVETILKQPLQISNRMINRLTRMKGIRLNGRTPWLKKQVKKGDRLQVAIRPREKAELPPRPVPLQIVYEDADLMVVDKPAGVLVHPVHPEDEHTLAHGITFIWKERGFEGIVRPVHRLDRYTSGLILIAKNAYMHQLLDRQLRQKQIERIYLALLGKPLPKEKGTIQEPIGKDPDHPTKRMVSPNGSPAITHYQVIEQNEHGSLITVRLETGRTHQIRVHFAHLGFPLIGDPLYGGDCTLISRQALHSAKLSFTHPLTGKIHTFTSPLPEDMNRVLSHLKIKQPSLD
ncbi:RluA family pseudouridine synthase [Thermoflavimicrobium dichotomicum]|uniref:Pseudouridine synthase n=1 Tax=Thermoflavimicrobium dichotomicum TaxID=46223 RepID=A0A1I3LWZ8_9BACL|nr:RluA family pseudouridine synthase [Thermoflavimicrobium dichotomicum]SFI89301.1 tRNA pseudouridine32 synthase / 23S rRNA pseudouridine746 synthase/23S rRNA pseudouridine1911/1915/1917 synthase [Thermoflavimicrobium dichotomicum]